MNALAACLEIKKLFPVHLSKYCVIFIFAYYTPVNQMLKYNYRKLLFDEYFDFYITELYGWSKEQNIFF